MASSWDGLIATPQLLRLPLVRSGQRLSVGYDEDSWKAMLMGLGQ